MEWVHKITAVDDCVYHFLYLVGWRASLDFIMASYLNFMGSGKMNHYNNACASNWCM